MSHHHGNRHKRELASCFVDNSRAWCMILVAAMYFGQYQTSLPIKSCMHHRAVTLGCQGRICYVVCKLCPPTRTGQDLFSSSHSHTAPLSSLCNMYGCVGCPRHIYTTPNTLRGHICSKRLFVSLREWGSYYTHTRWLILRNPLQMAGAQQRLIASCCRSVGRQKGLALACQPSRSLLPT